MLVAIIVMYIPTLIFLITGIVMKSHHSKFPDTYAGFHLSYAVKDEETWEESNQYAGQFCIRSSLFLLVINIAITCCYVIFQHAFSESTWGLIFLAYIFGALIIQLTLLFILPYCHLKKKFNDNRIEK